MPIHKANLMVVSMKTIERVSDNSVNWFADDVTLINIHARSLFTSRFLSHKNTKVSIEMP